MGQFWSDVYRGATVGEIALAVGLVLLVGLYVFSRGEEDLEPREEEESDER